MTNYSFKNQMCEFYNEITKIKNYKAYLYSALVLFLLSYSLILTRVILIPASEETTGRHYIRGDGYSDLNTLDSARFFLEHNLWDYKLRPVHLYNYETKDKSNIRIYTHYPPLTDLIAALSARFFKSSDERYMRITPVFFSLFWLVAMVSALWFATKDIKVVFWGGMFGMLSGYFIYWSDGLHKHMWEELFKWTFISLSLFYFKFGKSWKILFLQFLLAILISNTSFEPILFLAITSLGFSFIYEKDHHRIFNSWLWVVGLGFFAGLFLHLYLNKLYFGSWELTFHDMKTAFLHRTGIDTSSAPVTIDQLSANDYFKLPLIAYNRLERHFLFPGGVLIYLTYLTLKKYKSENFQLYKTSWFILIACFAWYFLFPQHSWVHGFIGKQSGMIWVFMCGQGVLIYKEKIIDQWRNLTTKRKFFEGVMMSYAFVMLFTQQILQLWWTNGFARLFKNLL